MGYMEQNYIFDFCSLFDIEQSKDIKDYIEQSNNTHSKLWK